MTQLSLFRLKSFSKLPMPLCIGFITTTLFSQSAQAETMYVYKDSSGQALLTNMNQPSGNLSKFKKEVSKKTYAAINNHRRGNSYYMPNANYGQSNGYGYSPNSNSRNRNAYDGMIKASASRYGVDPALVKAIIHTESAFNPGARSPVGAQGLMQLMPGTARELRVNNPWNPSENIDGGTKYISQLLRRFNNNAELALAGYNAGPNRESLRNGRIPNIRETQNYVKKVLSRYHSLYKNQPSLRGSSSYNSSNYKASNNNASNYNSAHNTNRNIPSKYPEGVALGANEVNGPPGSTNLSRTQGYASIESGSGGFQRVSYKSSNNGIQSVSTSNNKINSYSQSAYDALR